MKKAISPVIAIILLLSITVILSVGVYQFLQNYSQNTLENLDSSVIKSVKVIGVFNDNLYLQSNVDEIFSVFQIQDLNGNTMCEIKDSKQTTFQGDTKLLLTFDSENINSTHAIDISGNNNDGVLNGVTHSLNNCNSKQCYNFDGVNDFIQINSDDFNYNTSDFSIMLWAKAVDTNDFQQLLAGSQGVSSTRQYGLVLNLDMRLEFWATTDGIWGSKIIKNNISENEWFQVVAINSFKDKELRLYHNSIFLGSYSYNNNLSYSPSIVTLGKRFANGEFVNGSIDEVAIYSKTLTDSEIKLLYELKQAKFYEQLLTNNAKEIDVSNCGLTRNQKYNFIGIFQSGGQIKEEFVAE